jgi:hypothetical protein
MDRGGILCRQSRCCNSERSLTALPQLPEEECLSLNFSLQEDEEDEEEEEDEDEDEDEEEVDTVEEDEERLREVAGELALL